MNYPDPYKYLENQFVATFLNELVPGIFHNFANPLNGILGRSKLMQRRMAEFIKKIEARYRSIESDMGADYKKLDSDIHSISSESEKFFDMFRVATGKFYTLGTEGVEELNLSSMVEAELGFADFYMDYKHNTQKEICLDGEVPCITGKMACYSLALWILIRQATKNSRELDKAFRITTASDDRYVILTISHLRNSLINEWRDILSGNDDSDIDPRCTEDEKDLIYGLLLLKKSSNGVELTQEDDEDVFTIRIPHHQ
jgi:signal transduction histidine kinase